MKMRLLRCLESTETNYPATRRRNVGERKRWLDGV